MSTPNDIEIVPLVNDSTKNGSTTKTIHTQATTRKEVVTGPSTSIYRRRALFLLVLLMLLTGLWMLVDTEEEQDLALEDIKEKIEEDDDDDNDRTTGTVNPHENPSTSQSSNPVPAPRPAQPQPAQATMPSDMTDVCENQATPAVKTFTGTWPWPPTSFEPEHEIQSNPNIDYRPILQSQAGYYSTQAMMDRLALAKNDFWNKLKKDYGCETFNKIFFVDDPALADPDVPLSDNKPRIPVGRLNLGSPDTVSWQRMVRKMTMKLLQVQQHAVANRSLRRLDESRMVPFVWATGGHSSSAGHGNWYRESYTATLERALRKGFDSVGIYFTGRNYAMGGKKSFPEIAFCEEQIFGTDIDVLGWDFGMTDGGRSFEKMDGYFRRAGLLPSRPACVALQVGRDDTTKNQKVHIMQLLEDAGLTAMFMRHQYFDDAFTFMPDSLGKSSNEIVNLPPYVQNMVCHGGVEKGEPYCDDQKFNSRYCENRKFKTSWHPGWKWHGFLGNLLALSLFEMMEDALKQIQSFGAVDPAAKIHELKAQEDEEYKKFFSSDLDQFAMLPLGGSTKDYADDVDRNLIFKKKTICRTALLPSESRYRGIMTQTTTEVGFENFRQGQEVHELVKLPNDSDEMRLSYTNEDRQDCDEVLLNVDMKDFFVVSAAEGAKKVTLPNDAEQAAYGTDEPLKGMVAIVLSTCSWGHCPKEDVREETLLTDAVIKVNGVPADGFSSIDSEAIFLKHNGNFFFQPNAQGRFEFEIQVLRADSWLRVQSFVIF